MIGAWLLSRRLRRKLDAIRDPIVRFWTHYCVHLESAMRESGYEPFHLPAPPFGIDVQFHTASNQRATT